MHNKSKILYFRNSYIDLDDKDSYEAHSFEYYYNNVNSHIINHHHS